MQKFAATIAMCFALAGCQTPTQEADAKADKLWEAAGPYAKCVVARADELARQPEDPYYLALAAKASCARQRSEVADVISRVYRPATWQDINRIVDKRVEEAAITRIVNRRASGGV
ncbi:MAG: hypothetical protein EOR73_26595 [Mesorhizobium sp.]|nr:MAG: hypothetical protein EOR73_26595 [Mesorhizobium sp.]